MAAPLPFVSSKEEEVARYETEFKQHATKWPRCRGANAERMKRGSYSPSWVDTDKAAWGRRAKPSSRGLTDMGETCIRCGACDHPCPGKIDAIYRVEDDFFGRIAIVLGECIECSLCVPLCPVDCIRDVRKEGVV